MWAVPRNKTFCLNATPDLPVWGHLKGLNSEEDPCSSRMDPHHPSYSDSGNADAYSRRLTVNDQWGWCVDEKKKQHSHTHTLPCGTVMDRVVERYCGHHWVKMVNYLFSVVAQRLKINTKCLSWRALLCRGNSKLQVPKTASMWSSS